MERVCGALTHPDGFGDISVRRGSLRAGKNAQAPGPDDFGVTDPFAVRTCMLAQSFDLYRLPRLWQLKKTKQVDQVVGGL
jgi:hypothetical protein